MTQTDDIKMVITHDRQGTPAYNTGLAKVAVSCSADSLVVAENFVLRIKFSGKNPAHRKSANHWSK